MEPHEHEPQRGRFEERYWQEDTHYGRLGDYDAALSATMQWYSALVRLTSPHLPRRGRHLDVGCGHGAIVHLMLGRGLDSYGFDASAWMIEKAKRARPQLAERFATGDASEPPPFRGPFDLVTCIEVLEHLDDPEAAIAQIAAALRDGGILVATTPNPKNFMPFRNPALNDPTHVSVHEPAWWRAALERGALEIVDDSTYLALPFVWRLMPVLSRWVRFRHDIAPGWVVVARRTSREAQ